MFTQLTLNLRVCTVTEDWPGNYKHKFKLSLNSFLPFLSESGWFNEAVYATALSLAGDASSLFNLITVTVKSTHIASAIPLSDRCVTEQQRQ